MATITGTLTDADGVGVEDATITVTEAGSDTFEAETTTDANGDYSVFVGADIYDVRASKLGYDPVERTDVDVGTGETVTVNLSTTRAGYKVRGEFDDAYGTAVVGRNRASTGTPTGVVGATPDVGFNLAFGVRGTTAATRNDAAGVYGRSNGPLGATGVRGVTEGSGGSLVGPRDPVAGVEGVATTTTGSANGVTGITNTRSDGNAGVEGTSRATTGETHGVRGSTASGDGYGLYTPDAAKVEGDLATTSGHTVVVDGTPAFSVGPEGTNDLGLAVGGNLVAGYEGNDATSTVGATIAGGGSEPGSSVTGPNRVTDDYGAVGGGSDNRAGDATSDAESARWATVGGGLINTAAGETSTVGGGSGNLAADDSATVAGGAENDAFGRTSTIAGGALNRTGVSGTDRGIDAMVVGGRKNVAEGDSSLAGGFAAEARDDGTFVWGDRSNVLMASDAAGTNNSPTGPNTVHVQATGGLRLVTGFDSNNDPNAGQYLDAGGSTWKTVSARSAKREVRPVDPRSVLDGVESLTVSRWQYDANPGVDRMGPMAGEFTEAFELGDDPETIGHVDADGVALAAIQGLADRVEEETRALRDRLADRDERIDAQREQIDAQRDRIDDLEAENERLRERLAALEARLGASGPERPSDRDR